MIIGCTGHRPSKLNGDYEYKSTLSRWIFDQITGILRRYEPEYLLDGGAIGVDTIAAFAAIKINIPLWLALPCRGQDKYWRDINKYHYSILKAKAAKIDYVHDGPYYTGCMNKRNYWMNDRTDLLISVSDGSKGGTFDCTQDARSKGKEIITINLKELTLF